jgi:DNA-directed RNA polymerase specialized sigma24 family protein
VSETTELLKLAQPIAARVARTVGQQFTGYVESADLLQDLVLWTLEHESQVTGYLVPCEDQECGKDCAALREGQRKCHTAFRRVARGIANEVKAERLGYRVEDLHFYSKALLEELLPVALADAEEWWLDIGGSQPEGPRPPSDPAEGNNRLAMLCDVKAAFLAGSDSDRTLLSEHYLEGIEIATLASVYAVVELTIRRRLDRALGRMVERLGGTRPDFGAKPRREVLSNEAAQRLTREAA